MKMKTLGASITLAEGYSRYKKVMRRDGSLEIVLCVLGDAYGLRLSDVLAAKIQVIKDRQYAEMMNDTLDDTFKAWYRGDEAMFPDMIAKWPTHGGFNRGA